MARVYEFTVGPHEVGLRLDQYLLRHLPQTLSRVAIQRVIRAGLVTADGMAAKAHRRIRAGERVVARLEQLPTPSTAATCLPEPIPLDVVYEDDQLLVVNKPAGLVTHPAPGHWSGTLVNAALWHLRSGARHQTSDIGLPRAGIVHRLDKDTSGLLLIAKTDVALRTLAKQLKARTVTRRYLALVEGHMAFDEGTINAAIGRHPRDRKVMAVRHLGGRHAVTHYRVLKRMGGDRSGMESQKIHTHEGREAPLSPSLPCPATLPFPYTALEVWLETGRTHQIRVHLAHQGHPVLGDAVYSRHPASFWSALGISRQLLHASSLRFVHPTTQHAVELHAEIPPDLGQWLGEGLGEL